MEQDIDKLIELIQALGVIASLTLAGVLSIIAILIINKATERK